MQIKKPIPSPSKAAPAQDSSVGSLVQYDDEGQVILGLVTGFKKDKLSVLNFRGREGDLIRARLYFLPGRDLAGLGTNAARVEALQKLADQIEQDSQQHNIQELWSFVHEDAKQYSVAELCELYCGSNACVSHAGLRVALIRDKIHFKRDKDLFEPRPQHVVDDLLKAEAVKSKKKAAREQALLFIEQRTQNHSLKVPSELRDSIRLLEEVAAIIVHTDPSRQKEARDFVHACAERLHIAESMPLEKRAFEVMQRAGFFHEHTNLAFIRHDISVSFSEDVLDEAVRISMPSTIDEYPDDERSFRRDYTGARAFTIDDVSTRDMDDALSLERTPEGYELGIHVTDVTVGVAPDSLLDKVARRRTTSIYCADQTVNMLPEVLSEKVLSLAVGAPKPCISVILQLSDDFNILSSSIVPSFVRIAERYTYDQVDELLEQGDQTLLLLHDIAAALEERRIRKGAMRVQKREVVPTFENGAVVLQEIHEDSPARLLVSEMMVLANSIMAEFAARHGIPVLYRGQERPYDDTQGATAEQAPEGPAKDFSARLKLKKSSVSFTPQYHAGLGLDAYIQATSPIRRYMDLCHQRQFISYQRYGRPWITQEQFELVAAELEVPLQAAALASRETKRYWLLRYLEQRPRNQPIEGTVVRTDLKSPLVELDEVYITIPVRMQQKASLGQRVSLKISAVDPHADYIRVS